MIRASGTWCTSHWQHWGDTWAMIELRLSTSIQNHPKWGIAGKFWNMWENLFLFVCGKELWNKGHWPIWQRKQWPRSRKYLLEYQLECNWQKCSCWDTKKIKLHAVESCRLPAGPKAVTCITIENDWSCKAIFLETMFLRGAGEMDVCFWCLCSQTKNDAYFVCLATCVFHRINDSIWKRKMMNKFS